MEAVYVRFGAFSSRNSLPLETSGDQSSCLEIRADWATCPLDRIVLRLKILRASLVQHQQVRIIRAK